MWIDVTRAAKHNRLKFPFSETFFSSCFSFEDINIPVLSWNISRTHLILTSPGLKIVSLIKQLSFSSQYVDLKFSTQRQLWLIMKFVSLHIPKVWKIVQGALRLFRGHLKWKLVRHSLNQLCFRFILTELVKKICALLPQNTVIPKPSTVYSPKPLLSTSIAAVMSTCYRLYGIFEEIFTFRTQMFWVNLPPINFSKRMASHLRVCTTKQ